MPSKEHTERADIYIAHTELEWVAAKAMARALDACGYVVTPTKTLELPDRPVVSALPADADAVIVIWPIAPTEFGMPALELEARAAAQRGNLIQVYAGVARPIETYRGPPPVDFTAWDHDAQSKQFRALLRRVSPLCGGPRRRPRNTVNSTSNAVLTGTLAVALASIFFVLGQSSHHPDKLMAAAPPPPSPPEDGVTRVALSAVAKGKHVEDVTFAAEPELQPDIGGPDGYTDIGVDSADVRLAPAPTPPPQPVIVTRAPQGPEQ